MGDWRTAYMGLDFWYGRVVVSKLRKNLTMSLKLKGGGSRVVDALGCIRMAEVMPDATGNIGDVHEVDESCVI